MKRQSTTHSDFDRYCMSLALEEALAAKGLTHPNPAVGAVVALNGNVISRGRTDRCGGAHAEVRALKKAGSKARGADLYVTLEPCCHFGRTPPCTDAVIRAGIRKVFVSVKDPFAVVGGKGIAALRKSGIAVDLGLGAEQAGEINEDFFWSVRTGKPWVSLKLAMTLDGCIADSTGCSKWISCEDSRNVVQLLRRYHSAVAVGRKTLCADNASLTVRNGSAAKPARIVFASRASLPPTCNFVSGAGAVRSIVVCPHSGDSKKTIRADGVEIWRCKGSSLAQVFDSFLQVADREGMRSILVEGGSELASGLLEAGLVNRLYLFFAPLVLGGGLRALTFKKELSLDAALGLGKVQYQRLGKDVLVTGILEHAVKG